MNFINFGGFKMSNSKIQDKFKKLVLEIENSKNGKEDSEFLEELRKLAGYETVEKMKERFKKLAGL
jgi:hypothetical protein